MKFFKFLKVLVMVIFIFPISAMSQTEVNSDVTSENNAQIPTYVICKNKDVVRTIRVERMSASCKTTYTKNGEEKVVGKSKKEEVCSEVLTNIKKNLEESNWKCKDISASRISSSL